MLKLLVVYHGSFPSLDGSCQMALNASYEYCNIPAWNDID